MGVTITIYTDGAVSRNGTAQAIGGYAAVLVARDHRGRLLKQLIVSGGVEANSETRITNQRMEIMAVIAGLEALTKPATVTVVSDSEYVVCTMNERWDSQKNLDLWDRLHHLCTIHRVTFTWTRGHAGHTFNELADEFARAEVESRKEP